jgi:hypothetical protein
VSFHVPRKSAQSAGDDPQSRTASKASSFT